MNQPHSRVQGISKAENFLVDSRVGKLDIPQGLNINYLVHSCKQQQIIIFGPMINKWYGDCFRKRSVVRLVDAVALQQQNQCAVYFLISSTPPLVN